MLNTQNVRLRISAGKIEQFPRDPLPQVAFSGRSNVGKSSLINALLGQKKLARVSSSPGKTITVNFYEVDRKLYFVDLPGYGFARRSSSDAAVWRALTDGYFTKNPNADRTALTVQLIDSRIGPTEDDAMMLSFLRESGIPCLIALTKTDKLNKTERADMLASLAEYPLTAELPIVPFSALSGEGKNELLKKMLSFLPSV